MTAVGHTAAARIDPIRTAIGRTSAGRIADRRSRIAGCDATVRHNWVADRMSARHHSRLGDRTVAVGGRRIDHRRHRANIADTAAAPHRSMRPDDWPDATSDRIPRGGAGLTLLLLAD